MEGLSLDCINIILILLLKLLQLHVFIPIFCFMFCTFFLLPVNYDFSSGFHVCLQLKLAEN